MKRHIACFTPTLTFRGSCVALYDYAHYTETMLGHCAVVATLYNKEADPDSARAYQWIARRFPIVSANTLRSLEQKLVDLHTDFVYCIKHGQLDDVRFTRIPYGVHCVFSMLTPHGSVYAAVSETLARKFTSVTGHVPPHVPHMVTMTSLVQQRIKPLRDVWDIPKHATVIGRYGGRDTWNLHWIAESMRDALSTHPHLYFVLMNTPLTLEHPRVRHIDAIASTEFKKRFITACDAMIVPETLGHTFGLSIAEFQVFQKPILCYNGPELWNRAHCDVLGPHGLYFHTPRELALHIARLVTGSPISSVNAYAEFTPHNAMRRFEEIFLSTPQN